MLPGFDPCESGRHFPARRNPERFDAAGEQRFNCERRTPPSDVAAELDKLLAADLVILQFPLWWFGPPAILKGWMDRVFVYGGLYSSERRHDRGVCSGKRALLCVTTGSAEAACSPDGREGDTQLILWPTLYALRYVGFTVLQPILIHSVRSGLHGTEAEAQDQYLARETQRYRELLLDLRSIPVVTFNSDDDWDEHDGDRTKWALAEEERRATNEAGLPGKRVVTPSWHERRARADSQERQERRDEGERIDGQGVLRTPSLNRDSGERRPHDEARRRASVQPRVGGHHSRLAHQLRHERHVPDAEGVSQEPHQGCDARQHPDREDARGRGEGDERHEACTGKVGPHQEPAAIDPVGEHTRDEARRSGSRGRARGDRSHARDRTGGLVDEQREGDDGERVSDGRQGLPHPEEVEASVFPEGVGRHLSRPSIHVQVVLRAASAWTYHRA